MSSAKITLFTFANYLNQHNDDLFKLLTVPSGIDKDVLTENILLRGGEFEVLYSDPIFMQNAIGAWSRKWQRTMQKWIDALSIDYNPLENYDRYEQWHDVENKKNETERLLNHNDNRTLDYSDDRTIDTKNSMLRNLRDAEDRDLEDKETRDYSDTTTYDKTIVTEREVSAYDSSSYQPAEKTTETDSNGNNVEVKAEGTDTFDHTGTDIFNHTGTEDFSNSGTDNVKHSGSDNMAHTGTIKDEGKEDNTTNRAGHVHGNIGVTTSQQMLEAELNLAKWNIYENITDLFLTEFIIPIYT